MRWVQRAHGGLAVSRGAALPTDSCDSDGPGPGTQGMTDRDRVTRMTGTSLSRGPCDGKDPCRRPLDEDAFATTVWVCLEWRTDWPALSPKHPSYPGRVGPRELVWTSAVRRRPDAAPAPDLYQEKWLFLAVCGSDLESELTTSPLRLLCLSQYILLFPGKFPPH